MKYSFNRRMLNINTAWVDGPVVGSMAWGLNRYSLNSQQVGELIEVGAVHYSAIGAEMFEDEQAWVLWMCDKCHDSLADVFPFLLGVSIKGVRTTSEEAAKGLCMCCDAERRRLPELMMYSPSAVEISNEERGYIMAARVKAEQFKANWPVSNDGIW